MDHFKNPLTREDIAYSILQFVHIDQRVYFNELSKEWKQFAGNEKYAHWNCLRLSEDGRIYAPPRPSPGSNWMMVLKELWSLRNLWTLNPYSVTNDAISKIDPIASVSGISEGDKSQGGEEDGDAPQWWRRDPNDVKKYNIGVLVRFRPEKEKKSNKDSSDSTDTGEKFYLPLHQRLAIIRSREQRKKKMSKAKENESGSKKPVVDESTTGKEASSDGNSMKKRGGGTSALKMLQGEGGWFGKEWKKATLIEKDNLNGSSSDASNNEEGAASLSAHIHDVDPMSARVVAVAPGIGLREFDYDHVLPSRATQSSVYEAATRRLLTDFLNGINATILVYGQTGSGKTYTMFGEQPTAVTVSPPAPIKTAPSIESAAPENVSFEEQKEANEGMSSDEKAISLSSLREGRLNKFDKEKENNNSNNNNDATLGSAKKVEPTNATTKTDQETAVDSKLSETSSSETKASFIYKEKGLRGIVPRAAEEVLQAVTEKKKKGIDAKVVVSYVEVFGDDVTDLLHHGARCGHSKVAAQRYVLSGATGQEVTSLEEIAQLLQQGESQKRKAATAMNDRSSRAHALFIMTLDQYDMKTDRRVKSQLFLADLGGSENVKRSEVHHGAMHEHYGHILGNQMREAVYINLGLLALKKCIDALNRGNSYVPYQDSKLTMLLSPALGGDSKTSVVVCGSMDIDDAKETVQTLRFGEACRLVTNSAGVQAKGAAALLEAMEREMEELEQIISKKERWETSQKLREDVNAEEDTVEAAIQASRGGEIVRVDKIVGAEEERARLEKLIVKRAELLGEDVDMSLAEAGFGGQFGAKANAMGGHAALRFAPKSQGLKMKGKVVAEWVS